MGLASFSALRASHGYPQFVAGATVARLADEMFSVGVVLLVLRRTGSPTLAGLTVAAATLPTVVSAPVIGAWLDSTGRRSLLLKIDRLLLVACLLGIVLAAGHAPDFVIPLLAFITGTTMPATFGGLTSLIPLIVEEELLPRANAVEAASFNTALIVGPALAGTVAALAGPTAAVLVEAALTVVALVLLLRIPDLDRGGAGAREPLAQTVKDGLRFAAREPVLRATTVTALFNMAGGGFMIVAFPLWAAADLGVGQSAAGHLWAAFAFGSLLGALLLAERQRRHVQEVVLFAGLAVSAAISLTWLLAASLPVALVLVALAAVPEGPALAASFAVRQERTPPGLQAHVMSTLAGLKIGALSIGAAVAGPLAHPLGPRGLIAVAAGLSFVGVAAGLATRGHRGSRPANPASISCQKPISASPSSQQR